MKPFRLALPRTSGLARAIVAAALAGVVFAPAPALGAPQPPQAAQAGQDDNERARELFRKGREEYAKEGHLPQAYGYFLQAWGLEKSADIAGNLAVVERQLSLFRDAAEHAAFALSHLPPSSTDAQHKALKDLLDDVRPNIGAITVQVSVERAVVTVDGKPVGESPLPSDVFVDPGRHVVVATAPGCEPAKDTVPTDKGTTHLVNLTPRCGGAGGPNHPPQTPHPPTTAEGPRPLTIAGFVTSGVGFGLGTAFAILSRTKADDANQQQQTILGPAGNNPMACAGVHAPAGCQNLASLRSSEATFANAALGTFIAAGAVAAGTLVYTFAIPRAPATTGDSSREDGPGRGDPRRRPRRRRGVAEGSVLMDRPSFRGTRGWLLPLGLLATIGFAAAEAAGCFNSLDDCPSTLYYGCGTAIAGTTSGSDTGTGTGTGASTSTSTSTGMGGTSGSSGTGTGGTKPECTSASDCTTTAVPAGPCASLGAVVCKAGKCGVEYQAGPAPSQEYGNCEKNVCDPNGVESQVADSTNFFDNGNPCTPGYCNGSGLSMNTFNPDAGCMIQTMTGPQSGVCTADPDPDAMGLYTCEECDWIAGTGCTAGVTTCILGKCVPASCRNGVLDTGETDVDCGGTTCPPCKSPKKCLKPSDCFSHVCSLVDGGTPTCQAPTCSDNVQNGLESGTDCGGPSPSCRRCNPTETCYEASDCASGVCKPATFPGTPDTCQAPSCTDGVQNGSETGIDCGGDGGCPPCADGG